jgi:hypothetical protein
MDPRDWVRDWWQGGEPLVPPSQTAFYGFSAGLLLFVIVVASVDFVPVLDHVNLAFHESGHLLFRLFGDTASLYGGTLMQFVFPSITAAHFAQRGQTLSSAACAVWFCENLRYMALYMADARAQILPLVGGGEHDWYNILSRWDALESDTRLAGFFSFLCWAGIVAIWVVLWRMVRRAQAGG